MSIYSIKNNKLKKVKKNSFKLEKEIQSFVEANLNELFGLEFIQTEFQLNGLRIDTLAYDKETDSFVIIEYKRGKSFSVVDQGFSYLSLMLNNKAEFILEYNEQSDSSLKRDDIDWSQSRVLFIANSFTKHQQNAINFKDLPIELWEIERYEGDLINMHLIEANNNSESIEKISNSSAVKSVTKEVKKYSVDDHFNDGWNSTREIYTAFTENLFDAYPELNESPQKQYIGFKLDNWNVISTYIQKSGVVLILNRHRPEDLNDPDNKTTYWNGSYERYNQHMTKFKIKDIEDIEYAMYLVKQVYKNFEKNN